MMPIGVEVELLPPDVATVRLMDAAWLISERKGTAADKRGTFMG